MIWWLTDAILKAKWTKECVFVMLPGLHEMVLTFASANLSRMLWSMDVTSIWSQARFFSHGARAELSAVSKPNWFGCDRSDMLYWSVFWQDASTWIILILPVAENAYISDSIKSVYTLSDTCCFSRSSMLLGGACWPGFWKVVNVQANMHAPVSDKLTALPEDPL